MNRQVILNRINVLLARFVSFIELQNKNGWYDANLHAENIIVPLLNRLYGLNLKNANLLEMNFPSVDLIDSTNRTTIQVTSTSGSTKIKNTLKKFIEHKLYEKYDNLYVYILTKKQKRYSSNYSNIVNGSFNFNPKTNIIDTTDISNMINHVEDLEELLKIQEILEAEFSDLKNSLIEHDKNIKAQIETNLQKFKTKEITRHENEFIDMFKTITFGQGYISRRLSKLSSGNEDNIFSEKKILTDAQDIVIFGEAGLGKSLLLKNLLIKAKKNELYPLLIPAVQLFVRNTSLEDYLVANIQVSNPEIASEQIKVTMVSLPILLLIDGIDEYGANRQHLYSLIAEIKDVQNKFPKFKIILSSRPNLPLSLAFLENFHLEPFNSTDISNFCAKWNINKTWLLGNANELHLGIPKFWSHKFGSLMKQTVEVFKEKGVLHPTLSKYELKTTSLSNPFLLSCLSLISKQEDSQNRTFDELLDDALLITFEKYSARVTDLVNSFEIDATWYKEILEFIAYQFFISRKISVSKKDLMKLINRYFAEEGFDKISFIELGRITTVFIDEIALLREVSSGEIRFHHELLKSHLAMQYMGSNNSWREDLDLELAYTDDYRYIMLASVEKELYNDIFNDFKKSIHSLILKNEKLRDYLSWVIEMSAQYQNSSHYVGVIATYLQLSLEKFRYLSTLHSLAKRIFMQIWKKLGINLEDDPRYFLKYNYDGDSILYLVKQVELKDVENNINLFIEKGDSFNCEEKLKLEETDHLYFLNFLYGLYQYVYVSQNDHIERFQRNLVDLMILTNSDSISTNSDLPLELLASDYRCLAHNTGNNEKIVEFSTKAINLDPEGQDYRLRSLAHTNLKLFDQAIDDFLRGNKYLLSDNLKKEYHRIGIILWHGLREEGRHKDIIRILLPILETGIERSNSLFQLAEAYGAVKNWEAALKYYLEFYELEPESPNEISINCKIGECYRNLEKYDEALTWYNKQTLNNRAKNCCYNMIGLCQYDLKNYQAAENAYLKSHELDPSWGKEHYHNNIGLAFLRQKKMELAHLSFTTYEQLFPGEWRPYKNWTLYYSVLPNHSKAIEYLNKVVEMGCDDYDWLSSEEFFLKLRDDPRFQEIVSRIKSNAAS